MGGISSFTVSALDCHHLDPTKQKYITGDLVPVIYPNMAYKAHGGDRLINKTLTLTSVKYDLHHPEKNEYTCGIPNGTISKTYGTSANKKTASKSSISSSVGETIGPVGGSLPKVDYERKATAEELERTAWKYVFDGQYNNKKYEELKARNPEAAERASMMSYAAILRNITPEDDPEYWEQNRQIDSILFDGPKAQMLVQKSIPKELQQVLVARGKIDPSKMPTAETREKMDTAISIVADGYVSKLTMEERLAIDPRIVVTDKVRAAELIADKGDRKTGLDIALETGLLKDPSSVAPFQRPAASARLTRFVQGSATQYDPYGVTNSTTKVAANMDGDTATVSSEVLTAGLQGLPTSATAILDGINSIIKFVNPSDSGNFTNEKLTGKMDGSTGFFSSIKGLFGLNGSGGKSTIDLDGLAAKFTVKPTSSAGVSGTETFQADGSGEVKAGKSGGDWQITLNAPISYVDNDGASRTLNSGALRAEDFQLYSNLHPVDSFSCKFAYFDTVVVVDLYAVKAYVDQISASTIQAGVWVRSDSSLFNDITANTSVTAPVYYYKADSMGAINMCSSVITNWRFQESNGNIKLQGTRLNSQTEWSDLASFNMAATTFYSNAVAAARSSGRTDVYVNSISIEGGTSATYNLHYTDPSTGHEMNTGRSFTVTASAGGGGAPEVDLNGAGFSYTEYNSPPTTPMQKSNGVIIGHIWYRKANGKWAYLRQFSISYPTR